MPAPPQTFQFTPAHDGRLRAACELASVLGVSIHARARRATCPHARLAAQFRFQFTPAHDGRPQVNPSFSEYRSFNSRPRTTGDVRDRVELARIAVSIHARARRATRAKRFGRRGRCVSIHARARRATGRVMAAVVKLEGFNSRPRTTGDFRRVMTLVDALFQFTPAHDGRPVSQGRNRLRMGFNSRPRTTGDCRL